MTWKRRVPRSSTSIRAWRRSPKNAGAAAARGGRLTRLVDGSGATPASPGWAVTANPASASWWWRMSVGCPGTVTRSLGGSPTRLRRLTGGHEEAGSQSCMVAMAPSALRVVAAERDLHRVPRRRAGRLRGTYRCGRRPAGSNSAARTSPHLVMAAHAVLARGETAQTHPEPDTHDECSP